MPAFTIPEKPAAFTAAGVAPGCRRIANLYERPLMGRIVDVLVVHTNWASGEGTIESAVNWSKAAPGRNTYAHYQHDLDGDAAKMLDTDRRGIGNSGTAAYWQQFNLPNASWRALVFETADRGTRTDPAPDGSYFTEAQMASLARDLAYECVVHNIPSRLLEAPNGRGICGHTWPFPYPAFTTSDGKKCPGFRKIDQLVTTVIPWTAAIVAAWTAPPPVQAPIEEDDMQEVLAAIAALDAKIDAVAAKVAEVDGDAAAREATMTRFRAYVQTAFRAVVDGERAIVNMNRTIFGKVAGVDVDVDAVLAKLDELADASASPNPPPAA